MSKVKAMHKTIETNIVKDFGQFKTDRSFIKQKFNDIKRSKIKTYSVSVYIDSNVEVVKEDMDGTQYTFKEFSKDKISKTIKSLDKKVFAAFEAIDKSDNKFKYVIVDTDNDEFYQLKRVNNTNIFYSVISQDVLKIELEESEFSQLTSKEQVIEQLRKLQDEDTKFKEDKNGRFLVSFFMFSTKGDDDE